MAKHNKKRNVGLIHEQLVRYASQQLVDGNNDTAETALQILGKHFTNEAELQREFKLFNSLVHTQVPTKELARRIIEESRAACVKHSAAKLRSEKSLLIRDINHMLNKNDFYSKKIPEYKIFATVQALLNEWRGANRLSPREIVSYELVLENWLFRDSERSTLDKVKYANPLTLKLMIEKFNKKYINSLNKAQTCLIEAKLMGNDESVQQQTEKLKARSQNALNSFYQSCDNRVLNEKKDAVKKQIISFQPGHTEEIIAKALMLSSLIDELENNNE